MLRLWRRPSSIEEVIAQLHKSSKVSRGEIVTAIQQLRRCGLIFALYSQDSRERWAPDIALLPRAPSKYAAFDRFRLSAIEHWRTLAKPASQLLRSLTGLLTIQLRGPNLEKLFAAFAPRLGILFSSRAVPRWLVLAFATAGLVLTNFDRLLSEVDSWVTILQPATGGMLLLIVLITRGIHESGHAVVAARHGVRCPDVGMYLFCGVPCLYCDVSESWLLTDRRQRAAVAAAGMYVELLLAMGAAWIWLLTHSGPLHFIAMKTMLVCSFGSLLVNLNPLLRFDGYYILADWLDEPNLRRRADRVAVDTCSKWLMGNTRRIEGQTPSRTWFYLGFSLSSLAFRIMLSSAIAWGLAAWMEQWNMAWLGKGLAILLLMGWWGGHLMKLATLVVSQLRNRSKRFQFAWIMVGAWALSLLPLPTRVFVEGWIEPLRMHGVYAPELSTLTDSLVEDGARVIAGQTLFTLTSPQAKLDRNVAVRAVADSQIALRHAIYRQQIQPAHRPQDVILGDLEARLDNAKKEWLASDQRLQALVVTAPCTGVFIADLIKESVSTLGHSSSLNWTDSANRERIINSGERLGIIADNTWRAMVPIESEMLAKVKPGTRVKLRLHQELSSIVAGKVSEIITIDDSKEPWRPSQAASNPPQPAMHELAGEARSKRFAAIIELPEELGRERTLRPGCAVDAVFTGEPASCLRRMLDWFSEHVRWPVD
jgi:putative peptide zinc metalloprotease protein